METGHIKEQVGQDADSLVDTVSRENHAHLIGEEATAMYVEYLRSGGNIQELSDAIMKVTNELTVRIALAEIIQELLKGESKGV